MCLTVTSIKTRLLNLRKLISPPPFFYKYKPYSISKPQSGGDPRLELKVQNRHLLVW